MLSKVSSTTQGASFVALLLLNDVPHHCFVFTSCGFFLRQPLFAQTAK